MITRGATCAVTRVPWFYALFKRLHSQLHSQLVVCRHTLSTWDEVTVRDHPRSNGHQRRARASIVLRNGAFCAVEQRSLWQTVFRIQTVTVVSETVIVWWCTCDGSCLQNNALVTAHVKTYVCLIYINLYQVTCKQSSECVHWVPVKWPFFGC